ncbi:MAG TPA: SMP-30/gluconolactonase/LRE family protein [Cyclobacteriaceae bacterium]|nr:SMP-30/gluconolactonase/LRE family protein [Cyclobacteriaceae bacterium]
MKTNSIIAAFILTPIMISCISGNKKSIEKETRTIGSIERISPALDELVNPSAVIEVLADGFEWTEGPVWVSSGNYLLFSDIPPNRIYKWSETDSIQIYLEPSGFTGPAGRGGEEGSNGLLIDSQGRLVLCQHGDRRVAIMNTPLNDPKPDFITLVGDYEGKRLNSPNDAVFSSTGDLFITDPPYGLLKQEEDTAKELAFQGVFRRSADGNLTLLTDELSRPNGIGLSPDEKKLYVANSDPQKAIWMAYDLTADGKTENGRVFYDATEKAKTDQGLPDGLKVHSKGFVFATGPGGVWIFDPAGAPLGIIRTTVATANCAFNTDESILYITADMYLLRVKL